MVDAVDMTVGDTDTESLATVEMHNPTSPLMVEERDEASAFEGDHLDPVEELVEQVSRSPFTTQGGFHKRVAQP